MARKRKKELGEYREFGKRLTRAIESSGRCKGLTQDEVGKFLANVSGATISYWEGGHRLPTGDHLIHISNKLKISLDWLLFGEGAMRRTTVKGEVYHTGHWPKPAQEVVRGFSAIYDSQEAKDQ